MLAFTTVAIQSRYKIVKITSGMKDGPPPRMDDATFSTFLQQRKHKETLEHLSIYTATKFKNLDENRKMKINFTDKKTNSLDKKKLNFFKLLRKKQL